MKWMNLLATQRGINEIVKNHIKNDYSFNLSTKEKRALHKLIAEKNEVHIIIDTDKNLGPANANKSNIIMECKRQLFDIVSFLKLSAEKAKVFY